MDPTPTEVFGADSQLPLIAEAETGITYFLCKYSVNHHLKLMLMANRLKIVSLNRNTK